MSLAELLAERRAKFPSSGEINFRVVDAAASLAAVRAAYASGAEVEELDGLSIAHPTWRLNVRQSNTEPLVRLNLEARGSEVDLAAKADEVAAVIKGAV